MNYKQLQAKLKQFKADGMQVNCKLNAKAEVLQAEYNRLMELKQQALDAYIDTDKVDAKLAATAAELEANPIHHEPTLAEQCDLWADTATLWWGQKCDLPVAVDLENATAMYGNTLEYYSSYPCEVVEVNLPVGETQRHVNYTCSESAFAPACSLLKGQSTELTCEVQLPESQPEVKAVRVVNYVSHKEVTHQAYTKRERTQLIDSGKLDTHIAHGYERVSAECCLLPETQQNKSVSVPKPTKKNDYLKAAAPNAAPRHKQADGTMATSYKQRTSKAAKPTPIVNTAANLPKVKVEYSKKPQSEYFVDTVHSRYLEKLGDTERQALRNANAAMRKAQQGLNNIKSFAQGLRDGWVYGHEALAK